MLDIDSGDKGHWCTYLTGIQFTVIAEVGVVIAEAVEVDTCLFGNGAAVVALFDHMDRGASMVNNIEAEYLSKNCSDNAGIHDITRVVTNLPRAQLSTRTGDIVI